MRAYLVFYLVAGGFALLPSLLRRRAPELDSFIQLFIRCAATSVTVWTLGTLLFTESETIPATKEVSLGLTLASVVLVFTTINALVEATDEKLIIERVRRRLKRLESRNGGSSGA